MENEVYYPPLSEETIWSLGILKEQLDSNPDYLSSPDCPYGETVVGLLGDRMAIEVEEVGDVDLEEEAKALFKSLKESSLEMGKGETTEKMAYFRTATSLMEKLISFQERAHNIKQVGTFYRTVMVVLEEFLTPDQITAVRGRFSEYL